MLACIVFVEYAWCVGGSDFAFVGLVAFVGLGVSVVNVGVFCLWRVAPKEALKNVKMVAPKNALKNVKRVAPKNALKKVKRVAPKNALKSQKIARGDQKIQEGRVSVFAFVSKRFSGLG